MSHLDSDLIHPVKGYLRLSGQVKRVMKDESGSVEAGLTLIPLTILFLISAQLVFASQWGNMQQLRQQSETNRAAISGSTTLDSRKAFQSNLGTHTQYLRAIPLLGGGQLIISERTEPIPLLANFTGLNGQRFTYRNRVGAVSERFTR
jgi:hypothetical protein